jgi:hypothetical protein
VACDIIDFPDIRVIVKSLARGRRKVEMRWMVKNVMLAEEDNISSTDFQTSQDLLKHSEIAASKRQDDPRIAKVYRFKRDRDDFHPAGEKLILAHSGDIGIQMVIGVV